MVENAKKDKAETPAASTEKKKNTKKDKPDLLAASTADDKSVKSSKKGPKKSQVEKKPSTRSIPSVPTTTETKNSKDKATPEVKSATSDQQHEIKPNEIHLASAEHGSVQSKKVKPSLPLSEVGVKRKGSKTTSEVSGHLSVMSEAYPRLSLEMTEEEEAGEEILGERMESKPGSGDIGAIDVDFYDRVGPPTPPTTGVSFQGFDPSTTKVLYYIDSCGDIINEMVSEPDFGVIPSHSSRSSVSIPCELDECGQEPPPEEDSDEEEDRILRERFPGVFTEHEPWLTPIYEHQQGMEQDGILYPEDAEVPVPEEEDLNISEFKFTHLDMSCRGLHDLSMIQHFSSLKSLTLSNNFLRTLKELSKMIKLIKLNVTENEITDFLDIPTKFLLPLQEVNMSRNHVSKIINLKPFWALTIVNLSYNRLSVIDNFQDCQYLRVLNLAHNTITEIRNLICPYLVILILKSNELDNIDGLEHCRSVRYLNISNNRIRSLATLRSMPRLMELRCKDNLIKDLLELEALTPLLNLNRLILSPNDCIEIGMSRAMLVFMLPQLTYLDGKIIIPEEIVEARNTFNPTIQKRAFEDHSDSMMEKATQSATLMFQDFCNLYPLPPMLFLVGSPKSDASRLAMFLKKKLNYNILLGGVHSTATTIEGGNSKPDIPISLESFMELKNRGEMLSTSSILGRMCGFSMSQVIKASERRALLVATIPLSTAICLKHWNFKPKLVLLLPSGRPHFGVDDFIAAMAAREVEKKEHPDPETVPEEPDHDHLIHFAERTATQHEHKEPATARDTVPMHSILKIHHDRDEDAWKIDENLTSKTVLPNTRESITLGMTDGPPDVKATSSSTTLSKTKRTTIIFGDEASNIKEKSIDEVAPVKLEVEIGALSATAFNRLGSVDENGNLGLEAEEDEDGSTERRLSASTANVEDAALSSKEAPPFTVTNRLRRLQRLMTPLFTQTLNTEISQDQFIPNPGLEYPEIETEVKSRIDWRQTILRSQLYNTLLDSDDQYFMVVEPTVERPESGDETAAFRTSLIPHKKRLETASTPPSSQETQGILDKFELIVRKLETVVVEEEEFEDEEEILGEVDENANIGGYGDTGIGAETRSDSQDIESNLLLRLGRFKLKSNSIERKHKKSVEPGPKYSMEEEGEYESLEGMYGGGDAIAEMEGEIEGEMEGEGPTSPEAELDLLLDGHTMGDLLRKSMDDEDEDNDESGNTPQARRFKHRDALEKAIMKTRDDYLKFHLENPGFFSAVVDTTDFEKSCHEFYDFAKLVLHQFQDGKHKHHLVDTHSGKNEVDRPLFINEKLRHFKAQSKEWSKGYHHPLQHMRSTSSSYIDLGTIFEKHRRPTNLLDPSFSRPLGIAKVKQLKHVTAMRQNSEKKAECRALVKSTRKPKPRKRSQVNKKLKEVKVDEKPLDETLKPENAEEEKASAGESGEEE